jgi:hypothetical protein
MDEYKSQDPGLRREQELYRRRSVDKLDSAAPSREDNRTLTGEEIVREYLGERKQKAIRRKWTGRIMIVFGIMTMLSSCPFYALALIPGQSVMAGVAVMIAGIAIAAGGGAILAWRPRLKDTNEALIVALKHGNRLTVSRLALEMDISFQKAEKIIQELVRSGIAEIDLDYNDPDHSIVYKIRGF